jgi:hypothetical protein
MAHKWAKEMMMYAKDAAEIDEPWKLWECRDPNASNEWSDMLDHPHWYLDCEYRRKPKAIVKNRFKLQELVDLVKENDIKHAEEQKIIME